MKTHRTGPVPAAGGFLDGKPGAVLQALVLLAVLAALAGPACEGTPSSRKPSPPPRSSGQLDSASPAPWLAPALDIFLLPFSPACLSLLTARAEDRDKRAAALMRPGGRAAGQGIFRQIRLPTGLRGIFSPERHPPGVLFEQIRQQHLIIRRTPTLPPAHGPLSSPYGWRRSPFTGRREFHRGVDIASPKATPVRAAADGVVSFYGRAGSSGNVMEIDHGGSVLTRYCHLHKPAVHEGRRVRKGERIAYLGNSGRSTKAHLHYEITVRGVNVNPQRYMLK